MRHVDRAAAATGFAGAARTGAFWRLAIAFTLVPVVSIGINFHLGVAEFAGVAFPIRGVGGT